MTVFILGDLERELRRDREVRKVEDDAAAEALRNARAIAAGFVASGDYLASLQVDGNFLYSDDPAGHIIEWGSSRTQPYGVLRAATEQTGARYVDNGP